MVRGLFSNIRTYVTIGLITAIGFIFGCRTAHYNLREIQRVSKPAARVSEQITSEPAGSLIVLSDPNNSIDSMSFEKKRALYERFNGNVPSVGAFLYFVGADGGLEFKLMNTTGSVNGALPSINKAIGYLPENAEGFRLNIGSPDRGLTGRGQENQLSSACGILGIDVFYPEDSNQVKLGMDVRETIGIRGGREYSQFNITFTFGDKASIEDVVLRKERNDYLFAIETAENAGIGAAVAGGVGAIASAVYDLGNGIWAYVEANNNSPNGAYQSDNLLSTGLDLQAAYVREILRYTQSKNAKHIIFYNYGGGVGVVYADNSLVGVTAEDGRLHLKTEFEGPPHLWKLLNQAALRSAVIGAICEGCKDEDKHHPSPGYGGGEIVGPGGKGFGGGEQGGPGGGSR